MAMKTVLNCGSGDRKCKIVPEYAAYKEVRLDDCAEYEPDILASIVAMPQVETSAYDAVFCSHCIEHLYYHEVMLALREFERVLKPEGFLEIRTPDLQGIGGKLALDEADVAMYMSGFGPITPLDILFGHRGKVAAGLSGMAHKSGFTKTVLKQLLLRAGFEKVSVERMGQGTCPELKALAIKGKSHANGELMSTSAAESSYAGAV